MYDYVIGEFFSFFFLHVFFYWDLFCIANQIHISI